MMKSIFVKLFTVIVLTVVFIACNDEKKKPGTATEHTEKQPGPDSANSKKADGSEGISIGTKGGTQVSVGDEGGEVKTKDLDVQVRPGSLPNQ